MRWIKLGWVALLLILFLMFSAWYGGNGKPISAEEGADLLEQLEANYPNPPDNERDFLENMTLPSP